MDPAYFMDAVITPHRSLSSRGLIILIGVLTFINCASAGFFLHIGAGPVPIFLGLDVAAVAIALRARQRAGSQRERVQVTDAEVRVVLETPRGARTVWVSPTAFTRVALVGAPGDEDDLQLTVSDKRLRVARSLSRPERLAFAEALDRAIRRARAARPKVFEDRRLRG
jgi:uncharacterized membrane protein